MICRPRLERQKKNMVMYGKLAPMHLFPFPWFSLIYVLKYAANVTIKYKIAIKLAKKPIGDGYCIIQH